MQDAKIMYKYQKGKQILSNFWKSKQKKNQDYPKNFTSSLSTQIY